MLRVRFTSLAAVGKPAGVYLKTDNAVALDVLGTASIRTYLGNQEVERFNIAHDVVSLAMQNTDEKKPGFYAAQQDDTRATYSGTIATLRLP